MDEQDALISLSLDKKSEKKFRTAFRQRKLRLRILPSRSSPTSPFTFLFTTPAAELVRTERILVALARGVPVLDAFAALPLLTDTTYISEQIIKQAEINQPEDWAVNLWLGAPRFWRMRRSKNPAVGIFANQKVILDPNLPKAKIALLKLIVTEGGGECLDEGMFTEATFGVGSCISWPAGLLRVKQNFLLDLLSLVELDLDQYVEQGDDAMDWARYSKTDFLDVSEADSAPPNDNFSQAAGFEATETRDDGLLMGNQRSKVREKEECLTATRTFDDKRERSEASIDIRRCEMTENGPSSFSRKRRRISTIDLTESPGRQHTSADSPDGDTAPILDAKPTVGTHRCRADEENASSSDVQFHVRDSPHSGSISPAGIVQIQSPVASPSLNSPTSQPKVSSESSVARRIPRGSDPLRAVAVLATENDRIERREKALWAIEDIDIVESDSADPRYLADVMDQNSELITRRQNPRNVAGEPFSLMQPQVALKLLTISSPGKQLSERNPADYKNDTCIVHAVNHLALCRSAAMQSRLIRAGDDTKYQIVGLPEGRSQMDWVFSHGSLSKSVTLQKRREVSSLYLAVLPWLRFLRLDSAGSVVKRVVEDLVEHTLGHGTEESIPVPELWQRYSKVDGLRVGGGNIFWSSLESVFTERINIGSLTKVHARDLLLRCLICVSSHADWPMKMRSGIWFFLQNLGLQESDCGFKEAIPQITLTSLACVPTEKFLEHFFKRTRRYRQKEGCLCTSVRSTKPEEINFADPCSMTMSIVRLYSKVDGSQSFASRLLRREPRPATTPIDFYKSHLAHTVSLIVALNLCFTATTSFVPLLRRTIFDSTSKADTFFRYKLFLQGLRQTAICNEALSETVSREISSILTKSLALSVRGREIDELERQDGHDRGFALDHAREQQKSLAASVTNAIQWLERIASQEFNGLHKVKPFLGNWIAIPITEEMICHTACNSTLLLLNTLVDKLLTDNEDDLAGHSQKDSDTVFEEIDEREIIDHYEISKILYKALPIAKQFASQRISGRLAAKIALIALRHGLTNASEIATTLPYSSFELGDTETRRKARQKEIEFWSTLSGSGAFSDVLRQSRGIQVAVTSSLMNCIVAWDSTIIQFLYELIKNLSGLRLDSSQTWLCPPVLGRLKCGTDLYAEAPVIALCFIGGLGEYWTETCRNMDLQLYATISELKRCGLDVESIRLKSICTQMVSSIREDLKDVEKQSSHPSRRQEILSYCSRVAKTLSACFAASPFLFEGCSPEARTIEAIDTTKRLVDIRRALDGSESISIESTIAALLLRGIGDQLGQEIQRRGCSTRAAISIIFWSIQTPEAVVQGLFPGAPVPNSFSSPSQALLRASSGLTCHRRKRSLEQARNLVGRVILPKLLLEVRGTELRSLPTLISNFIAASTVQVEEEGLGAAGALEPATLHSLMSSTLIGLGSQSEGRAPLRHLQRVVWDSDLLEMCHMLLSRITTDPTEQLQRQYYVEKFLSLFLDFLMHGERSVIPRSGSLTTMLEWAIGGLKPISWSTDYSLPSASLLSKWKPFQQMRGKGHVTARLSAVKILCDADLSAQFAACWPAWDFPWSIFDVSVGNPGDIPTCLSKMLLARLMHRNRLAISRCFTTQSAQICEQALRSLHGAARAHELQLKKSRSSMTRSDRAILW